MYYPAYVISPFSQAKRKLSNSAKRLAVTELILWIINCIFHGVIIFFLFKMVDDYSYYLLLDFIFYVLIMMFWMITLWIAQIVVIVVNYVFFFMLSSSFTSLGNSEIRIADSAKKTGNYMLAGIITSIIATIMSIFNFLTNFIITIGAAALLTYAFYQEVKTFKDLEKINLYQGTCGGIGSIINSASFDNLNNPMMKKSDETNRRTRKKIIMIAATLIG
ncbi:hypothetical protein ES705_47773 [subsurface metagenome]